MGPIPLAAHAVNQQAPAAWQRHVGPVASEVAGNKLIPGFRPAPAPLSELAPPKLKS